MHYSESRNIDDDRMDLTDGYVVLGSGLSAVATVHALLDKKWVKQPKIYVLDAGINSTSQVQWKNGQQIRMPSTKFKSAQGRYVYDYFHSALGITEKNFSAIGSLAKGGLSNIWGATLQPYCKEDLSQFPYCLDQIEDIYAIINSILTNEQGNSDDEAGKESTPCLLHRFKTYAPKLAINSKFGGSRRCGLNSCDVGCITCNRQVYNGALEIEHLNRLGKIKYIPDIFIESVDKRGEFYYLACEDLVTREKLTIRTKTIFSCLGTISTTNIVLKMTGTTLKIPFLTTPGGAFFIFSPRKNRLGKPGILASRGFTGNADGKSFTGNIFPVSRNLLESYFGKVISSIAELLLGKWLFPRLFVANIYFSSDLGESTIENSSEGLVVSGSLKRARLKRVFREAMNITTKNLIKQDLFVLPLSKKLLAYGQDIHYGGTLPMKRNPAKNQCNPIGELYGFKGFFVADSSSMPYLAGKGHSFNSMVNSYYIATNAVEHGY